MRRMSIFLPEFVETMEYFGAELYCYRAGRENSSKTVPWYKLRSAIVAHSGNERIEVKQTRIKDAELEEILNQSCGNDYNWNDREDKSDIWRYVVYHLRGFIVFCLRTKGRSCSSKNVDRVESEIISRLIQQSMARIAVPVHELSLQAEFPDGLQTLGETLRKFDETVNPFRTHLTRIKEPINWMHKLDMSFSECNEVWRIVTDFADIEGSFICFTTAPQSMRSKCQYEACFTLDKKMIWVRHFLDNELQEFVTVNCSIEGEYSYEKIKVNLTNGVVTVDKAGKVNEKEMPWAKELISRVIATVNEHILRIETRLKSYMLYI